VRVDRLEHVAVEARVLAALAVALPAARRRTRNTEPCPALPAPEALGLPQRRALLELARLAHPLAAPDGFP
jgi:hypothetical protein